jgi:hypothetical protein
MGYGVYTSMGIKVEFSRMVELINWNPDFAGAFGDKRIEKRAIKALGKLTMGPQ